MKKILLGMVMAFMVITANAAQDGHVRKVFAKPYLSDSQVETALREVGPLPDGLQLVPMSDETDELGIRHQAFRQMYNGVEVESHVVIVHSRGGKITSITGSLLQTEIEPARKAAPRAAATRYIQKNGQYREVYKIQQGTEEVYIDVETGEELERIPLVYTLYSGTITGTPVSGRGQTLYNGWREMDMTQVDSAYYLWDSERKISTSDVSAYPYNPGDYVSLLPDSVIQAMQVAMAAGDMLKAGQILRYFTAGYYVERADIYSFVPDSTGAAPQQSGLFDVHWGMQNTYDFYLQKFNRHSYDNQGSIIYNMVFPALTDSMVFPSIPNNAAANFGSTIPYMYYGTGDSVKMREVVALDVMAHEFTHIVTNYNGHGGLVYVDESGALNESFSDIMAMGVYQFALDTCPWTIGEGIMLEQRAMRSMVNPHEFGDPDTYLNDTCWYVKADSTEREMMKYVHKNSAVQNHWFYLLSDGGKGVSGIGLDDALDIAYRNLIYYLAPNAQHHDARSGSVLAATDIYGAESAEVAAVKAAWDAVGVFDSEETALEVVCEEPSVSKVLRDGQVLIVRDGVVYDVIGRKILTRVK